MFTRMSKGVLWVLVAAVVIGGFVGMAEEVGIGLLIWLGGLVLIWGLGVFVELINNILDIKKILPINIIYRLYGKLKCWIIWQHGLQHEYFKTVRLE